MLHTLCAPGGTLMKVNGKLPAWRVQDVCTGSLAFGTDTSDLGRDCKSKFTEDASAATLSSTVAESEAGAATCDLSTWGASLRASNKTCKVKQ